MREYTFILFLVFITITMFLKRETAIPFLSVREAAKQLVPEAEPSWKTLFSKEKTALLMLIPAAFFFLCFGMFEAYSFVRGYGFTTSDTVMYIVLALAIMLYAVDRFRATSSWLNSLFLVVWITYIVILFLILVLGDFSPLLFGIMGAGAVIIRIPIWIYQSEVSIEYSISPLFLYGIVTALLFSSMMLGRICTLLFFNRFDFGQNIVSMTAAGILTLISIITAVVFVLSMRRGSGVFFREPLAITKRPEADTEAFQTLCKKLKLTNREYQILKLYAFGRSVPFISSELFISESTVKTHIRRAYMKLEIHNKQELVSLIESLTYSGEYAADPATLSGVDM